MADIVTTQVFTDGEKGITATKLNNIVANSAIQPAFYSAKPVASTANPTDNLLLLQSGGAYAQIPFQKVIDSVNAGLPSGDAEIWSVRLRSYNAIGNPNFEVDQRNGGSTGTVVTGASVNWDRWGTFTQTGMAISSQRIAAPVPIPGTTLPAITSSPLRITLTTQKATLVASDLVDIHQSVEGPMMRELITDVHSCQLLVRSSVANLSFSVSFSDSTNTHSLVKLCTIPAANVWTLISLPNLPVWVASGSWGTTPGTVGYQLIIGLAAGATFTAPANDTWQNGYFIGAVGQSNFAASPVGSTFDLAFVQHEPGPVCSTLMDKPFNHNYDECLRYFQKTYNYAVLPGAISGLGVRTWIAYAAAAAAYGPTSFYKPMAKTPVITLYNFSTGVVNSVRDGFAVNHLGAATGNAGENGFAGITFTTATAGICEVYGQYLADTNW